MAQAAFLLNQENIVERERSMLNNAARNRLGSMVQRDCASFAKEQMSPRTSPKSAPQRRKSPSTEKAKLLGTQSRHKSFSATSLHLPKAPSPWHKLRVHLSRIAPLTFLDKVLPIISPNVPAKRYWDLLILIFVIYNSIVVPFDAGFEMTKPGWVGKLENSMDTFFFFDILVTFRTAYVDSQGNMIRDSNKIAKYYLRTWFPIDFLASFPFELIALLSGMDGTGQLTLLAFLKTPRLLRLGRLMRFFDRMKNANVFRIARLMFLMCLIAHWIACTWHMLYQFSSGSDMEWAFDGSLSMGTQYLEVFYKGFLLMVGDNVEPRNNLERSFCCVVLVLGACFYATVVGNMALLVNNLNATAARHKQRQDMIQGAVRYIGAPDAVQERIQEYFDYLGQYSHPGPEGMAFLAELPRSIFEDISIWLHKRVILEIPLFKGCEESFTTQLATRMHMEVYMPGETIFRHGDIGREMYIVMKGKVGVLNIYNELLSMLFETEFFGDLALLATARRTATCVAMSHCDLAVLSGLDLQMAMRDYPDSAAVIQQRALERFNTAQCGGTIPKPSVPIASKDQSHRFRSSMFSGGSPLRTTSSQSNPDVAPLGTLDRTRSTQGSGSLASQLSLHPGGNQLRLYRWTSSMSSTLAPGHEGEPRDFSDQLNAMVEALTKQVKLLEAKIDRVNTRLEKLDDNSLPPVLPTWVDENDDELRRAERSAIAGLRNFHKIANSKKREDKKGLD